MLKLRESWLTKLEEVRNEKYLSRADFCEEIGVNHLTYGKLIDLAIPPVSLRTIRKVKEYLEKQENEEQ
jgi:hypothetical protein